MDEKSLKQAFQKETEIHSILLEPQEKWQSSPRLGIWLHYSEKNGSKALRAAFFCLAVLSLFPP